MKFRLSLFKINTIFTYFLAANIVVPAPPKRKNQTKIIYAMQILYIIIPLTSGALVVN